ncbi:MAG: hypothetical protein HWN65_01995 [Candidatus Helarchaeota archaeon]|nr:hypothetical protein [Candidatus Helarchaeota archaeon]
MAQDKETVIQRVINFLYDALDRFRDTMNDLNQNVSVLMNSLKKAEGDLSGTGYQRSGADRSAVLTTMKAGTQTSSSSREKLIALLSGQAITPPKAVAAPRPAAGPPRPPAAGPPRPPAAGPPRPPAAGLPRLPAAAPPMAGPPRAPAAPMARPARPAAPAAPMAAPARPMLAGPPRTAAPAAGSGAPTISGLRDEMLKELKRLKSIMKGEK